METQFLIFICICICILSFPSNVISQTQNHPPPPPPPPPPPSPPPPFSPPPPIQFLSHPPPPPTVFAANSPAPQPATNPRHRPPPPWSPRRLPHAPPPFDHFPVWPPSNQSPSGSPAKEEINRGKSIGLMFLGVAGILQIVVITFLIIKRNQLLRNN